MDNTGNFPPDVVEVRVNQEDINIGQKKACEECPIALAIGRALNTKDVLVIRNALACGWAYELPESALVFMAEFDAGNPVLPFTFTMTKASKL